jgi:hypothetical protein
MKNEPRGQIRSAVSCYAEAALKRLAAHHRSTGRAMLEK